MSIHHATTAAKQLLMCDFLMGSIQEQWHSFPIKTTANAKLRETAKHNAYLVLCRFQSLSLECFLFPLLQAWKASCGLKTQLFKLRRGRGQPEEQERPQLQTRKPMASEELAREHKGKISPSEPSFSSNNWSKLSESFNYENARYSASPDLLASPTLCTGKERTIARSIRLGWLLDDRPPFLYTYGFFCL